MGAPQKKRTKEETPEKKLEKLLLEKRLNKREIKNLFLGRLSPSPTEEEVRAMEGLVQGVVLALSMGNGKPQNKSKKEVEAAIKLVEGLLPTAPPPPAAAPDEPLVDNKTPVPTAEEKEAEAPKDEAKAKIEGAAAQAEPAPSTAGDTPSWFGNRVAGMIIKEGEPSAPTNALPANASTNTSAVSAEKPIAEKPKKGEKTVSVISVVNPKKGTGKSTTAVGLAAGLARRGWRVLLVDLDPQAASTSGVGLAPDTLKKTVFDALFGLRASLPEAVMQTAYSGLEILTANASLATVESKNTTTGDRQETILHLQLSTVREDYDFIIVDTPPSCGLLTANAIVAADQMIVPVVWGSAFREEVSQLMDLISRLMGQGNPITGRIDWLWTFCQADVPAAGDSFEDAQKEWNAQAFNTRIRKDTAFQEAARTKKPIFYYNADAPGAGAQDYKDMVLEVLCANDLSGAGIDMPATLSVPPESEKASAPSEDKAAPPAPAPAAPPAPPVPPTPVVPDTKPEIKTEPPKPELAKPVEPPALRTTALPVPPTAPVAAASAASTAPVTNGDTERLLNELATALGRLALTRGQKNFFFKKAENGVSSKKGVEIVHFLQSVLKEAEKAQRPPGEWHIQRQELDAALKELRAGIKAEIKTSMSSVDNMEKRLAGLEAAKDNQSVSVGDKVNVFLASEAGRVAIKTAMPPADHVKVDADAINQAVTIALETQLQRVNRELVELDKKFETNEHGLSRLKSDLEAVARRQNDYLDRLHKLEEGGKRLTELETELKAVTAPHKHWRLWKAVLLALLLSIGATIAAFIRSAPSSTPPTTTVQAPAPTQNVEQAPAKAEAPKPAQTPQVALNKEEPKKAEAAQVQEAVPEMKETPAQRRARLKRQFGD